MPRERDNEALGLAAGEPAAAVDEAAATILVSRAVPPADPVSLAATGAGVRAFDDSWIAAQGAARPEPYGPLPAPAGPVPSGWTTADPEIAQPPTDPTTAG